MSVIWTFKPIGYSPKDCIDKLNIGKMTFAGRLDPIACGLQPLILHKESINNQDIQEIKKKLQNSYKTYQFKVILGLQSDSYDILGLVKKSEEIQIEQNLEKVKQIKIQEYPPFSSQKAFSNKSQKRLPLWKISKDGEIPKDIPKREIDIQSIKILSFEEMSNDKLLETVKMRLNALKDKTNFRNEEIMNCWLNLMKEDKIYKIYHLEATVSPGTYIRSICNFLSGTAYDICRTHMSNVSLEDIETIDKFEFAIVNTLQNIQDNYLNREKQEVVNMKNVLFIDDWY